jgi:hypothetical protein
MLRAAARLNSGTTGTKLPKWQHEKYGNVFWKGLKNEKGGVFSIGGRIGRTGNGG